VFAQFLKASKDPKYTVPQINAYPTATNAVQVLTTLIYAWTSDEVLDGERWPPIIFGGAMNIITAASLAYWDIPDKWRWACYILAGCGGGLSGLCMAWAHEICSSDNEERALTIATMNEIAYVFQAWLPLIIWRQVEAPQYHKGFTGVSVISAILILTALIVKFLHRREMLKLKVGSSDDVSEDGTDDVDHSMVVNPDSKKA
jgi:ACS family pantothenate transporter-like MFS transporter